MTQYYKIVFVAYLGESVKMCANISYILIAVNRYMLIGRDHLSILEKISKWEMKRVIQGSIAFSLLINIGHIWQFQVNSGRVYMIGIANGHYYDYT